ncbi:hypothetical protein PtA15_4A158 [Puccinia triticina]|uniref:SAP domain-containing protein n=1 Tax=Puccinia triticina TaxID=208348 RepID=A0ABY7CF48_9BASI|nr:uncharacterized protein PtA15_4A158 [Puccinia triticina]WAQ83710.1 hypothetical protein PtA15_4A158 [Puccinia triticina]
MPPRGQARKKLQPSPPRLGGQVTSRRTRSGRNFAPESTDVLGQQENDDSSSRLRTPRRAKQNRVTQSPPPPVGAKGRKRKVLVVESDEEEEVRPPRRPRRGRSPKRLTHCPRDKDRNAASTTSFDFTQSSSCTAPPVVTFPWGFSIPIAELTQADKTQLQFSRVSEADLAKVLTRIGCSVAGQSKTQLVQLCIAYALTIHQLPPLEPTLPTEPSQHQPNDLPLEPNQHQPIESDPQHQRRSSSADPINHSDPELQTPKASGSRETDLIQLETPVCRPNQVPSCTNRVPNQSTININFSSNALSDRQISSEATPRGTLPDDYDEIVPAIPLPMPQTSDAPMTDRNDPSPNESGNRVTPQDNNQRHPPPANLWSQATQTDILRILQVHTEKLSLIQDDIASAAENYQDIMEKLDGLHDKVDHQATRRTREKQTSTIDPSTVSRSGKFKKLIGLLFESLFGLPEGAILPPPPPTAREKKSWLRGVAASTRDNPEPDTHSDSEASETNSNSSEDISDPHFPYRRTGGPGHVSASQEQLKIMHDMMKEKGMRRFRFDFNLALSAPENRLCLNLAKDIFVCLAECDEYDGLRPEEKDPGVVLYHLTTYVKERYARKVRAANSWTPDEQTKNTNIVKRNARRTNLKAARLESAIEIGGLNHFLPVIKNACSDDETDDEALSAAPVASTSRRVSAGTKRHTKKFCKVRRLPWRSQALTEAFVALDEYRDRKKGGHLTSAKGDWLQLQDPVFLNSLEVNTSSDFPIKSILNQIKRSFR